MGTNFNCEDNNYNNKIRIEKACTIKNWDPKKAGTPNSELSYALSQGQTINSKKLTSTQYKIIEALAEANDCDEDDNIDILTVRDLMRAKERFGTSTDILSKLEIKEFRCDVKAGVANITAKNGEVVRIEFGLNAAPVKVTNADNGKTVQNSKVQTNKVNKTINKYEGFPKNWIPHIKNLAKSTGYSEELIMNIISYEGFTPVAKYKNENGGLYEVGFGHTTQANHNNKFGKGYKIDVATAFKWLGQDIKDKENKIKKFGKYYDYDNLPKPMQEAFIDVAFNRGEGRLDPDSKLFDANYRSVHYNIVKGYIGSAAVRLRQEKFYRHEAGLRKRNVQRFLKTLRNLKPEEIVCSMDLFNRELYYTKTINMLNQYEADSLRQEWSQIYYKAKRFIDKAN